jgi:arginine deiminase
MHLNVTSEIGKLKSVLVHLPGREIDLMVPPMMAQLLFDDILYGQVAREEHRRFQQLIRFIADEVIDIEDLLAEVLQDADAKEHIVRDLGKRNRLRRPIVDRLLEEPAEKLAETLIGGILREQEVSGDLPKFDLFPVPNLFFSRDPQIVIGDGVVISSMATQARRRESLLSKYVFENHPSFRDEKMFFVDFMAGEPERPMARNLPTLEGGDLLVLSRDIILIGITERTNRAGVQELAKALKASGSAVRTMIVVEMPKQRSFMHLDTVFTFTSHHECLIYPPVILPGGSQAAKVTSIDLTRRNVTSKQEKSLLGALKRLGHDMEPIYCGGPRSLDQQREQWTDGANAFTLAPGVILMYERNVRTTEELAAHGYNIIYEDDLLLGRVEMETWTDKKYALLIPGHELSRARGGPRCMTMPLVREDI